MARQIGRSGHQPRRGRSERLRRLGGGNVAPRRSSVVGYPEVASGLIGLRGLIRPSASAIREQKQWSLPRPGAQAGRIEFTLTMPSSRLLDPKRAPPRWRDVAGDRLARVGSDEEVATVALFAVLGRVLIFHCALRHF